MPEPFRLFFPASELAVRVALNDLTAILNAEGHGDALQSTAEIVLGEVLNNIVEHAYGSGHKGNIQLSCQSCAEALWFTIRDHGAPMPELRVPPGHPAQVDRSKQDLPEGGFGWFLVHSLAQDLHYRRLSGCNVLCFAIPYRSDPDSIGNGSVLK